MLLGMGKVDIDSRDEKGLIAWDYASGSVRELLEWESLDSYCLETLFMESIDEGVESG